MSSPTRLIPWRRADAQHGFGVVEVIIAVLLIMFVVSGMVLAMTGGSKLRGSARLQTALTNTGQRMIEQLSSENSWMQACAPPRCAIAGEFDEDGDLDLEDVDGAVEVVGAASGVPAAAESHAVPVDSDVDGVGTADEDGVIPDHYQVLLVIRPDADTVARYGGTAADLTRRFTTALDRDGNTLKGSLRVDACVARNQVDERMSIDGCDPTGTTNVKMEACPTNPPSTVYFQGCAPAWNWVQAVAESAPHTQPSPYVALNRVPPSAYSFSIRNLSTGDDPIPSSQAKVVDGSYVFQEIDAGTYQITGLPGSYTVGGVTHPRWRTKEIPADHDKPTGSVGVQPGVKNHALVMFRPPRTNSGVEFYFDRVVHHYRLTQGTYGPEKVGGPFAFVGERWAPTNEYQGDGAEEFCDQRMEPLISDNVQYDSKITNSADIWGIAKWNYVVSDDPEVHKHRTYYRQCWIYKTDYASSNSDSNCNLSAYRFFSDKWDRPYDEEGAVKTDHFVIEYSMRYCTYFRDELFHNYWRSVTMPDEIKPGAVKSAVYEIEPRPTTREIEFGPNGSLVGARSPRHLCQVRGHTTHQNHLDQSTCTPGGGIDRLYPGLNTDVMTPNDVQITNPTSGASENNSQNAHANDNASPAPLGMPAWATSGGLWVRPEGGIVSPLGAVANPTIHLRGDGECYWRDGPNVPGPWEGRCGGCNILWDTHIQFSQKCAVLTKTCTNRYVLETETYSSGWNNFDEGSGETRLLDIYGPTRVRPESGGDGNGCMVYNPVWPCTSIPPTVLNNNCTPYQPPPPSSVTLQPTEHQVSAGTTRVRHRPINAQPTVS